MTIKEVTAQLKADLKEYAADYEDPQDAVTDFADNYFGDNQSALAWLDQFDSETILDMLDNLRDDYTAGDIVDAFKDPQELANMVVSYLLETAPNCLA